MIFKTLYKQTGTGKIQEWTISVKGNAVTTVYGLSDGKKQTVTDLVKEGTNAGRSNATTPDEQALLQAQQEFDAKLKKGYVLDPRQAEAKKNNLGAVEPMLAFPIEKKEKYAVFPALAQPKLDGLRCIAIIVDGEVSLFSRTQKPILTVPHIVAELEDLYKGKTITLDGELYNHALKDDFNEITHLAKRDDVHEDSKQIQYHLYDVVGEGGWKARTSLLTTGKYIKLVKTISVGSREDLEAFQATCVEEGYEGCMYRNPEGDYENKRSPNLLKVKTFQDDEFKVVDVEEGSGRLMGAVGAFVLVTKTGQRFGAKPVGSLGLSQSFWKNRKSLIGKTGTVKFQNYTPDGIPRFPVFKAFRDE
jgi:ATP-dependent DNA ligase